MQDRRRDRVSLIGILLILLLRPAPPNPMIPSGSGVPRERLKDEFEVRPTRLWREPDSNHQSREGAVGAFANFPGAAYFS